MPFQADADLRQVPGLRWRIDEDGQTIAIHSPRKKLLDHLYFHGPDALGIYVERDTRRKFNRAVDRYISQVNELPLLAELGELDGLIIFQASGSEDIPKVFFRGRPPANAFRSPAKPGAPAQDSVLRGR